MEAENKNIPLLMSGGIFLFYNGYTSVSGRKYIRMKIKIRKTKGNAKIKLSLRSSI